jgi:hypothetical protein
MKKYLILLCISLTLVACGSSSTTTREERKAIAAGNSDFLSGDYAGAIKKYSEALQSNPTSPEGLFNLGSAQFAQGGKLLAAKDTTGKQLMEAGESNLSIVAKMKGRAFPIASMAYYNLANFKFSEENYKDAIDLYKASLRITPGFEECRRNLRIAQLKQQQNQDQNQDKNKNKDQNKDQNQDQNKDQNKDQNQDQNKDQNKDQQQQQDRMNQQTADQILQAMENKENNTRAKLIRNSQKQQPASQRSRKQW